MRLVRAITLDHRPASLTKRRERVAVEIVGEVRDHHDVLSTKARGTHRFAKTTGAVRIEIGERLVEEDDLLRFRVETRERGAFSLSRRETIHRPVCDGLETPAPQRVGDAVRRPAAERREEREVRARREAAQEHRPVPQEERRAVNLPPAPRERHEPASARRRVVFRRRSAPDEGQPGEYPKVTGQDWVVVQDHRGIVKDADGDICGNSGVARVRGRTLRYGEGCLLRAN